MAPLDIIKALGNSINLLYVALGRDLLLLFIPSHFRILFGELNVQH